MEGQKPKNFTLIKNENISTDEAIIANQASLQSTSQSNIKLKLVTSHGELLAQEKRKKELLALLLKQIKEEQKC